MKNKNNNPIFTYKSFAWALGTTSFRTKNFNYTNEKQLELLNNFWHIEDNKYEKWLSNSEIQTKYYYFLKANDFVKGDANNPAKDAREKTSGLRDLGLIDDNRRLTDVGRKLLSISKTNDFTSDNFLHIDKDSYIYFKQLLKTSAKINNNYVKPFLVVLYLISKYEYIEFDEFRYLVPLCVDKESLESVSNYINEYRKGNISIQEIVVNELLSKDNYKKCLNYFLESSVTEEVICNIGFNRKSRSYDKQYFKVYKAILELSYKKSKSNISKLYEEVTKLKLCGYWRKYLFRHKTKVRILKDFDTALNDIPLFKFSDEKEFKKEFFKIMHMFKAIATLDDYFDLNRRYFNLTDFFIFSEGKVKLDTIPYAYVTGFYKELPKVAFSEADEKLSMDIPLEEINKVFTKPTESDLCNRLSKMLNIHISTLEEAASIVYKNKYNRLDKLIKERFNKDVLIRLFEYFKDRKDKEIQSIVTDNADIPTIFEYIVGLSWYIISGYKGDVLSFMKLSLDSNLLPKTHAGGGTADIVWNYESTVAYPKHTLLIEATLALKDNQRRMEMEPVSRHLGDYIIDNDCNAYCMFVSTYLHVNVISNFRAQKNTPYYKKGKCVEGLKIIPVDVDQMMFLLRENISYTTAYKLFHASYNNDVAPIEWQAISIN